MRSLQRPYIVAIGRAKAHAFSKHTKLYCRAAGGIVIAYKVEVTTHLLAGIEFKEIQWRSG